MGGHEPGCVPLYWLAFDANVSCLSTPGVSARVIIRVVQPRSMLSSSWSLARRERCSLNRIMSCSLLKIRPCRNTVKRLMEFLTRMIMNCVFIPHLIKGIVRCNEEYLCILHSHTSTNAFTLFSSNQLQQYSIKHFSETIVLDGLVIF